MLVPFLKLKLKSYFSQTKKYHLIVHSQGPHFLSSTQSVLVLANNDEMYRKSTMEGL